MDITDPFLLVTAASAVAIFLTPLASRLIAQAVAEFSAEHGGDAGDLSRIRQRNRR